MGTVLFPQHVIARKRDGGELGRGEIESFVKGATDGSWADYQLSAFLMAVFLRGMTPRETAALTEAMLRSGVVADLSSIQAPKADKHSTGGVGDKVSLHLAPMVAACGVGVPMISGRGPRPHGRARSTSSSRSPDSGSAFPSPSTGTAGEDRRRADRPDGRARARRPQALRAARRHGDGRVHPAHLREHPQQEAGLGNRRRWSST